MATCLPLHREAQTRQGCLSHHWTRPKQPAGSLAGLSQNQKTAFSALPASNCLGRRLEGLWRIRKVGDPLSHLFIGIKEAIFTPGLAWFGVSQRSNTELKSVMCPIYCIILHLTNLLCHIATLWLAPPWAVFMGLLALCTHTLLTGSMTNMSTRIYSRTPLIWTLLGPNQSERGPHFRGLYYNTSYKLLLCLLCCH